MDINIQQLISDLKSLGFTQAQIGAAIGCSQPSVCDMASGKIGNKRPTYQTIVSLVALAKKHGVLPQKKTEATKATGNSPKLQSLRLQK